jgi:hypothetical protein
MRNTPMKRVIICLLALAILFGCTSSGSGKENETGSENATISGNCTGCYGENETANTTVNATMNNTQTDNTVVVKNGTKNETPKTQPTPPAPEPPKTACVGPNGYDIYARAITKYKGEEYKDECITASVVKKYYCKNDAVQSMNVECTPGYWCTNGTCLKFQGTCTDPDNRDVRLRTSITYTTSPFSSARETDSCEDAMTLKEWLCNGSKPYFELIPCGNGMKCDEGRCVRSKCTDSDGGDVPATYGIVVYTSGTDTENNEDRCITPERLKENYCDGDAVRIRYYGCNDTCRDGQCIPKIDAE